MKQKKRPAKNIYLLILGIIIVFILLFLLYFYNFNNNMGSPEGLMILIESTNTTTGLLKMVSQMNEKNISGLLMITPEFTNANCEDIKKSLSYGNIEIVASNVESPFWGVSYNEQKIRIMQMLDEIENCTGARPRIISSRYMASDMNTIKVAEELEIPYVTARGTTGTKATVYQPEGYHVKILSVSLIELVPFEYGSLCDYSFYERAGTPKDMEGELNRALEPLSEKEKIRFGEYQRITPTSHTYIGGNLKQWNDMWLNFWGRSKVQWVTLDEFMANPDWTIPLWQIPINQNNPYTAEKVHPLISYENEEKVGNICAV